MIQLLLILFLFSLPAWGQWGDVGSFGTAQEKVSDTTLSLTPSATLNSGNGGVCIFSTDNIGTSSGDNDDHTSVSDSVGNDWTQVGEHTNAASANQAVTVSVWTTVADTDLTNSDSMTFNTVSNATAKAARCWEFTVGSGNVITVEGTNTNEEQDGADAGSLASATVTSAEYLFIRVIGYESDADVTGLTATTNFTTCGVVSTDGGGEAGNIGSACEFRIVTSTSQTSDPTFTGDTTHDNASVFVVLKEAAAPEIAFDADAGTIESSDPTEWTHTPVGTPRAVIVLVFTTQNTDTIVSVTYGGDSLTEMSCSPKAQTGGQFFLHAFFLGTSIPTGAQTVSVDSTAASNRLFRSITLTANADTEVIDCDATIDSTSQANPSVTLSLSGRTSFAGLVFGSGHADVPADCTPLTDWTSRVEWDPGNRGGGVYTFDTIGSSDVTAGWTQTAEDALAIAFAVSEVSAAADSLMVIQ